MRVHISPLSPGRPPAEAELFSSWHGELLLICLAGAALIRTAADERELHEGDQAILSDGEPFLASARGEQEAWLQFVWAPGPNPCQSCWERDGRLLRGDPATEDP